MQCRGWTTKENLLFFVFLSVALLWYEQQQEKLDHPRHWGYAGETGPEHWGELTPEYSACKTGREQSPINITASSPADLPAIEFTYSAAALKIIDNGHTIQVNGDGHSFITIGAEHYRLVQFHFHHPSEEQINGKAHDLTVHLVHQDAQGHKAVIAVLVDTGESNPAIKTVFDHLPRSKDLEITAEATVNPEDMLPRVRGYYTFAGSLTTPPCSEGVTWYVLKQPITLSLAELAQFARLYPNNARPVQPLNGRTILSTR
jgi:carbonic anhydrase